MVSAASLIIYLGLLQGVVQAGWRVRGIELLQNYWAYRIDVEVNVARALERGEPPDRSWVLGVGPKGNYGWLRPAHFRDGVVPPNPGNDPKRFGLNFHAFTEHTKNGMGFAMEHCVNNVRDSWNPTVAEVRDIAKFPPIPKGYDYSYGGYDPKVMLGILTGGETGREPVLDDKGNPVLHPNGKPKTRDNHFFDFDNMQAIIGKRAADMYDLDPNRARVMLNQMAELARLASEGRKVESAEFKVELLQKKLQEKAKQLRWNDGRVKSIKGAVKTSPATSTNFGSYQELDVEETNRTLKTQAGKDYKAMQQVVNDITNAYVTARNAPNVDAIREITALPADVRGHLKTERQQMRLAEALDMHSGNGEHTAGACPYPAIFRPNPTA